MTTERRKLKLGKGTSFVKTHLKQLKQEGDSWEADFRALPKQKGQTETQYMGLVVAVSHSNPLVMLLTQYTPNVNDLADLLADAMRRPITESAHRPRQIVVRDNPRWKELFPHLEQLGIEVSIQNDLPHVEIVHEDFLRQMRRATTQPLVFYTLDRREETEEGEKGMSDVDLSLVPSTPDNYCTTEQIPLTGVEPSPISPKKTHVSETDDVKSDAVPADSPSASLTMLAKIVAGLNPEERAALAAMLAGGTEGG